MPVIGQSQPQHSELLEWCKRLSIEGSKLALTASSEQPEQLGPMALDGLDDKGMESPADGREHAII
jgi:hypothetical protein